MTSALQKKMPPDPGVNQRIASHPSSSIWVNASAGSGKTMVLTSRVMRLLLTGVPPSKILCLTYTRAGATEIANRVTERLSTWAVCDDNELSVQLGELQGAPPTKKEMVEARRLFAKVLSYAGGLRIRTIHAFCQEILSRFPLEAGLPPHFSLIDEQESEVLQNQVLDELLAKANEQPSSELAEALHVLVAAQGEKTFTDMLRETIQIRGRINEAADEAGGYKNLVSHLRHLFQLRPDETPSAIRQKMMQDLPQDDLRLMAMWLIEGGGDRDKKRAAKLTAVLEAVGTAREALFDLYCSAFLTQQYASLSDSYIAISKVRKLHPEIDKISSDEALRLRHALERIEAADIVERTESTLCFGQQFTTKLAARKTARAALDYDDLILQTEKLLQRPGIAPWILYKLDHGIDHILVDEAQDTSRAQWNIVQHLTSEFFVGAGARAETNRTLFVVGDEKQSIFSFQNADPEAFLSLRDFFAEKIRQADKNLERISLHTSFRSAPAILRAVDTIFAQDKARQGVSLDAVMHSPSKNKDGSDKIGRVEVWPLLKPLKEEGVKDGAWQLPLGYEDQHDPQAELAQQIAKKIKSWVEKKEILVGESRPIEAGDIMILLRRRGMFADMMVRALKAEKIPVTGVDRMRLMQQLPVMDLLALLRFVLLPEDDLNLASLLRSPLINFSEENLMEAAVKRDGTLWQSLKNKSDKFPEVLDYLSGKLGQADFSTPFAFLSDILNKPCPANKISGRQALWSRLGDEALDPVEELLNKAQHFVQTREPSLQNFLHWLMQSDVEIKRELDRGAGPEGGQIRIMTVHASKGLEAPIVFLPDTTAIPRTNDLPKFQWSKNNVPVFLSRQPKFGIAQSIWQAARDRQMEEYRRLFYVALTRASHRLYICGWLANKNDDASPESWYSLAATALKSLHQEIFLQNEEPRPEMIIGDLSFSSESPMKTLLPVDEKITLPAWATRSVQATSPALIIAPSQVALDTSAATPDFAFARGRIIHRLLQSLPDIPLDKRVRAVARYLDQPRHNLTPAQRDEIASEVLKLMGDTTFQHLFGSESLAEAPVAGSLNGAPAFRQIDRLCFTGDSIWIVDYKTNRPPPVDEKDIPLSYRQQLTEYQTLLKGIYPDKEIRCFLLWTYTPRLMEIFL